MATATLTRKPKAAKTVNIQERCDFGNGRVLYTVLSSNGVDQHRTTLVNGVATGCTCRERNGYTVRGKCYHATGCEKNEQERSTDQQQHVQEDQHTCITCWRRVKHAGQTCYACATGDYC